ncbi:ParA family protein [Desulfotignum balticum]|uniref:ParA family protein n=1 Tax=Desulfotignum balticum TaxID=115781 RepID=UPI000429D7AF|nr:AAA family ATPase [Desulfotignum balticum]
MKRISLFNHKGGVSKTTSVYHLGWMLTKLGKKVLLVDGDSQCNLSILTMGEDGFEAHLEATPENTIKELLKPAFKGQPKPLEALEAIQVKDNEKLFLIPGSFDLTEYDVALGMSFGFSEAIGTLANLPGSFNYLIRKYEEKYSIDYTIIDLNPSLSAINQTLFLTSDYFIVPTSCDYFSKLAIKSLKKILPSWENWAKKARQILHDSSYPMKNETPKYIGAIIQRYNIRLGKATQANQEIIDDIRHEIANNFFPNLYDAGMIIEQDDQKLFDIQVPDFNTLNALYHQHGYPVFEINEQMMRDAGWFGATLTTNEEKIELFRATYEDLANRVIEHAI